MAIWLKIPSSAGGSCCSCANQSGCDCNDNQCALECQAKAGTAQLCGFAEYTSPSIPPRMYRARALSGGWSDSIFTDQACTVPYSCGGAGGSPSESCNWSGSCTYDKNTCAETINGVQTCQPACGGAAGTSAACEIGGTNLPSTVALTQTTRTVTWDPSVCLVDSNAGLSKKFTGTGEETLSDEDTEDDALNRAVAGLAWAASDCLNDPAYRTQRGAGDLTFGFRWVQVRATAGASPFQPLTIGHSYQITIQYYRRLLGSSGPWLFYGQDQTTIVAEATVEQTMWFDVPNEDGWETRAQLCAMKDVTPL